MDREEQRTADTQITLLKSHHCLWLKIWYTTSPLHKVLLPIMHHAPLHLSGGHHTHPPITLYPLQGQFSSAIVHIYVWVCNKICLSINILLFCSALSTSPECIPTQGRIRTWNGFNPPAVPDSLNKSWGFWPSIEKGVSMIYIFLTFSCPQPKSVINKFLKKYHWLIGVIVNNIFHPFNHSFSKYLTLTVLQTYL